MERREALGPGGWFVSFQLVECSVDAEQLARSVVFDGVPALAMDAADGEVRFVFELEGGTDEVIGRAVEFAWTLLETEGADAELRRLVLSSGPLAIDCTQRLYELQQARQAFDSL